jgi:hypothetical protein
MTNTKMRSGSAAGAGRRGALVAAFLVVLAGGLGAQGGAQGGGQGQNNAQAQAAKTPRTVAPQDLTGYWVSIVTELWHYRMLVPDKGDYVYVPLNPEGRKVADAWDPAKDQASGNACKSYGAPALLGVPGRLHIYWQDDNTLRIDTDSGTQTRLLHFGGGAPQNEASSWQGYSAASWQGDENVDLRDGFGGPVLDPTGKPMPGRVLKQADYLKVVTTHLRPGYLQKNGVPYSGNATMEEYFDVFKDPYQGNTWMTVTTVVNDPQYLVEPLITHVHFKKIPDNSGWDPTQCRTDEAR